MSLLHLCLPVQTMMVNACGRVSCIDCVVSFLQQYRPLTQTRHLHAHALSRAGPQRQSQMHTQEYVYAWRPTANALLKAQKKGERQGYERQTTGPNPPVLDLLLCPLRAPLQQPSVAPLGLSKRERNSSAGTLPDNV